MTETDSFGRVNHIAANDSRYRIKQHHGRTVRFGNTTYKYDTFGRLKTKTETKHGFRPITTFYRWNSQSQLVELQSPFKGSWRYEYDSFGRRVAKYQIPQENQPLATEIPVKLNSRFWRKQLGKPSPTVDFPAKGTRFIYHHNQLVAEIPLQTNGNTALAENWEEAIYWLYQDDDFTPTARLHKGELHYTVSDQIGTITELISENGYIHYRQKLNLWGEVQVETLHHKRASNDEIICNLRFVGQYADEESGLYYNRFRYYSPETGQYVSSDPIGLLGGVNPYGYVGIPTAWVDPLGLAGCRKYQAEDVLGRRVYKNTQDIDPGIPQYVDPSVNKSIREKIANGATNLDLMKSGNAPIGVDGKQMNLHHVLGKEVGPMVELTQTTHQKYSRQLHGLIKDGTSFRNDPVLDRQYNRFRANYWKIRALDFI